MRADLFWFNDEQWSKIEPHLPTNQPGPQRHDDRRILSGIMHVQMVGCRWKDCPLEYGPHKTIYNRFALERARRLASHFRRGGRAFRTARASRAGQHSCENPPLRQRRKRGAQTQAIGVTKAGRNSKIHAVVDAFCRPWVLVLTPGNTADCAMAEACVSRIPGVSKLLADKGYDTNAFRRYLNKQAIASVRHSGQIQSQDPHPLRQARLQGPQRRRTLLLPP